MNEISAKDQKRVERAKRIYEQIVCDVNNDTNFSEYGVYRRNRLICNTQDRLAWLARDCESQTAKDIIMHYEDSLELLIACKGCEEDCE